MPRFLDTFTGRFVWIHDAGTVPYAILSHTWRTEEEGGEQTYGDVCRLQSAITELQKVAEEHVLASSSTHDDASAPITILSHPQLSEKIKGCCRVARDAGYRLVWIDSCCIDKTSSAELSEAINSMYEWYREADVCYVYLADVPDGEDPRAPESDFRDSKWHTRGWTLQELIAPERVIFLSCTWRFLGTKIGLASTLEQITNVDFAILAGRAALDSVSVAKRMSWAARRQTTRVEDRAYSLLGIFGVHMSPIYGEGTNAFLRLQEEVIKTIPDQSIFAWGRTCTLLSPAEAKFSVPGISNPGLLAPSPTHFEEIGDVTPLAPADFAMLISRPPWFESPPLHCVFTPQGVRVRLLGARFYSHEGIPRALLAADQDAAGCDECIRLAGTGVCTLVLLRCKDAAGSLIALALRFQDARMEGKENLPIASRVSCGDHLHAPFRVVRISKDTMAHIQLQPNPLELYLMRYYWEPCVTKTRRVGFAKEPGVDLWDRRDPAGAITLAPGCSEELAAVGFVASPLHCDRTKDGFVLTTSLSRDGFESQGSEEAERRVQIKVTLTRHCDERLEYLPETMVHVHFAVSHHPANYPSPTQVRYLIDYAL